MLASILDFFKKIYRSPDVRKKVLITALILGVYRFVAHIPAGGINPNTLRAFFAQSPLLSLMDVFSGGTLANFSIMALGLGPYITASIMFQILTYMVPKLEELSKEGEYGREKINQYTRIVTVPLAVVQSFLMFVLLRNQGVVPDMGPVQIVGLVVTMTAGAMLALWLGELISEYGVGNGVSLLIFAGIIARLPVAISQSAATYSNEDIFRIGIFLALSAAIIGFIVFMNESVRQIPINHSRRNRSNMPNSSYLPLRLNQAGVMPIIFAVSLVFLPSFLGQVLSGSTNPKLIEVGNWLLSSFNPQNLGYNLLYFLLVVGFTYFYTAISFNPEKIAEELQKNGSYIPGVRPGSQTQKYLQGILSKVTLAGAVFLGLIAVLPSLFQNVAGFQNMAIGGTGILIVVSVVIEVVRDLEGQLVMKRYERFLT